MSKKWFISIVAIGVGLGFATQKVKAVDRLSGGLNGGFAGPVREVITRPMISPHVAFSARTLARYRSLRDDRFVQSFAAPRFSHLKDYPELSRLNMELHPTVVEDALPRYAPGNDPIEKIKAARDASGTQLGALYISSSGLTLSLF